METAEIRRRFLSHFEGHGHTVVPSAPLPTPDPNLMFVVAGMVPFMPYFLGQQTPPWRRATSVQKCVRTLDIDEVGKTTRHGSFFQMNGNFSFGDYFKREAIRYAWDLTTKPQAQGGFGFEESRLWVTVYKDDDETYDLWRREIGVPESRIVRLGMAENFWSTGGPGPCGPDSEIFFDRGPEYGPEGGPEVDEERYLEFWNLVFMQYERGASADGGKDNFPILAELPAKSIDTGMGLERMAFLMQGVDNLYEIDEVFPVLARAAELAGKRYGARETDDVRLRVVADHVRTALMLIGDGVAPGNEGQSYVLRRMLRRAVRAMRLLGVEDPTMPELLPVSRDAMSPSYPELTRNFGRISALAYAEEQAFRSTLRAGTTILDTAVRDAKSSGAAQSGAAQSGTPTLSGEKAFQLHDTYGFPIDITLEMAAEQGVAVDEEGFRRLMREQRQRAQADAKAKKIGHADVSAYRAVLDAAGAATVFTGYDEVVTEGWVQAVLVGGEPVDAVGDGEDVELVLDRTPFYAEGGGQLADQGRVELSNGAVLEVLDVQTPVPGLVVHRARVHGEVTGGLGALGVVDVERRRSISRSHTATHLVHKAFREALGETATQAGSENSPGRFRFDFASTGAVPASVLGEVEERVNGVLADDLEVSAEVMSQDAALRAGAMALFGEKYGDEVRVVSVGDWARELCGGTHALRSGQLGLVKLLGESSIGAGVRRVEALVGTDAYAFLAREHLLVAQLTDALKVRPEELPERVDAILGRLREAERDLERLRSGALLQSAPGLAAGAREVGGVGGGGVGGGGGGGGGAVALVAHRAPDGTPVEDLRKLALDVRGRLPGDRPGVVAACAVAAGRPVIVVAVNEGARAVGLRAGELVRVAAQTLGGGGGGKDDVAQGGGSDPSRVDDALRALEQAVEQAHPASRR